MEILTTRQRFTPGDDCESRPCPGCVEIHGTRVRHLVLRGEPIQLLLPAFPGKSPNPRKVLGVLPDLGESLSLAYLDGMCGCIKACYPPGARVVICSDGRVFSDVVGIRDQDVTAYQRGLQAMIRRIGPDTLELFHLDDVYPQLNYDDMRSVLVARHGTDLAEIEHDVHQGGAALALYRGVTRFLVEDADRPDRQASRASIQRDSRARAYVVIQRSKAWGELLDEQFPDAVRLSIHPQACGSEKLGISLMDATDNWLTAWHSVAVDVGGRFLLMKRYQAESLDTELVYDGANPSHFRLKNPGSIPELVAAGRLPQACADQHTQHSHTPDPLVEGTHHESIVA
jgi:pyoverdine/dityrosine biosynthesis protein Dit1